MIPTLALVTWRESQRFALPIPLFLLWPIVLIVYLVANLVQLRTTDPNSNAAKALVAVSVFNNARGLRLCITDDETQLSLKVI